ncbi:MAG: Gfo/Idh/MocA family oxidoreductase [Kiritimatiellia bacterium]
MGKKIRLGVVGYGRGEELFNLAVAALEGIVATAVCDTARTKLEKAKETHPDIQVFEKYDEMLAGAGLDAVIIGTPGNSHAVFAEKALAKNIHVLSEIPIVYTMEEGRMLWDAHLKSNAIYMTASNSNFNGYIDAAFDLKKKGLFGDPIYVEAEYIHDIREYFDKTPWRKTLEPIRYCTHSLGPILRLIDEDLEWVSCFDTGSHINKEKGQHDVMAALFRTKSNVVVRLTVSFINEYGGGCYHHYRFFTTKGSFERTAPYQTSLNDPSGKPRTLFCSTDLPVYKGWIELPVAEMPVGCVGNSKAEGHGGIDYAMLDAFFNAIREGLPSPVSLLDGLRMTLPGTFAAESARRGGELTRITYPWSE